MTISEVSDSDLSKWIAEKLEPLSSLPNPDTCYKRDMDDFPTECWITTFELSRITRMHVPRWSSRDMVNDAQMTVMLLDKMNQDDDRSLRIRGLVGMAWFIGYGPWESESPKLGRAVAEAYALANGWKSE